MNASFSLNCSKSTPTNKIGRRKKGTVKSDPPATIKIANTLPTHLKIKDFHSITTVGLARADEALI